MNPFQQAMGELDAALTGHDFKEATRQMHHMPQTVEQWLDRGSSNPEWYLSDSGYSRVVFSTEGGYLFLTDNSRSQVKARWELCKPQRDAAEKVIRDEILKFWPEAASMWADEDAKRIVDSLLS